METGLVNCLCTRLLQWLQCEVSWFLYFSHWKWRIYRWDMIIYRLKIMHKSPWLRKKKLRWLNPPWNHDKMPDSCRQKPSFQWFTYVEKPSLSIFCMSCLGGVQHRSSYIPSWPPRFLSVHDLFDVFKVGWHEVAWRTVTSVTVRTAQGSKESRTL